MISERLWRRAAVWLTAASALCMAGIRPAQAVSSTVVISKVLLGDETGGNTKFVELHNLTGADINLTGWTIHKKSSGGTDLLFATLTGTIPKNCYFVLVSATYLVKHPTAVYDNGATVPDANFPSGSANNGGSLALFDASSTQVDAVAMKNGTASLTNAYVEGTPVVFNRGAGATYQTGIERLPDGVNTTDSDNNSADFVSLYGTSSQTYTVTPISSTQCTGGLTGPTVSNVVVNPTTGDPGTNGVTISATVTPGTNSATIASVTVNLTPLGGSATAAMTNNSGTWSATFNIPLAATAGDKSLVITATDAGSPAKTGAASGTFTVNSVVPPLTVAQARAMGANATAVTVRGVVVSNTSGTGQVYINDADGGAGVQVFKSGLTMPVGELIDATGPLQYFRGELEIAATVVTDRGATTPLTPTTITIPQMGTIGPSPDFAHPNEGRLLNLSNVTVTKASSTSSAANATYNITDNSGNTAVVFVPTAATAATLSNPITATTLQPGNVYNIAGCLSYFGATTGETRDNPTLFELKPRDANDVTFVSAALIQSVTADPLVITRGGSTSLTVNTDPSVSGTTVTVDLTALGGSASQSLTDNGGGVFTTTIPVSGTQAYGPATITVTATNGAKTLSSPLTLTIVTDNQNVTIAQARALPDYSLVTVSGNLTANLTTGTGQYYIQDTSGPKGVSGVALFDGQSRANSYSYGDTLTVTAVKTTFNGAVQLDFTGTYSGSNPNETPGSAPSAVTITETQWPPYPGVLTLTNSLQVISGSGTSNATYWATDGTSFGEIFLSSKAGITPALTVGTPYSVTGIVDYFTSATSATWEIKPRSSSDIAAGTAPAVIPTQVAYATQPVGGAPGAALATQPVVAVKDAGGNTVAGFTGPVSIAIKAGTGTAGAVLSGTTTVNAVGGVATFSGLSIDQAGTGYVLTATSGPYSVDSTAFNVATAIVPGDINKDGNVDVSDVVLALKVAAGLVSSTDTTVSFQAGNVAPKGAIDGVIDILDALRIDRAVKNLDTLP